MELGRYSGIESGRGGDDDDEESTGAGNKQEGQYHSLGEAGHGFFELWRKQEDERRHSMMGRLFETGSSKEDDEEDDDDEEEADGKKHKKQHPEARGQEQRDSEQAVADSAESPNARDSTEPQLPADTNTQHPAGHPSQHHDNRYNYKPAWQAEDDEKFQKIVDEMPELRDAPPRDLLKDEDTMPGEPPVAELTTNEAVRLEPEPAQPVEGYRAAESEQRYHGYTPAPGHTAEARHPSPSRFEGAEQPQSTGIVSPEPLGRIPGPDMNKRTPERGRSLRESMMAATIMTIAITGYLANRRRKAEHRTQQQAINKQQEHLKQQNQDIDHLARGQEEMRRQVAEQQTHAAAQQQRANREAQQQTGSEYGTHTRPSSEAATYAASQAPHAMEAAKGASSSKDAEAVARRAVEEARQAVTEEPQYRTEQDAWRRYVVDAQGHEVQNVIQYGHEYAHERQQELVDGRHGQAAGPARTKPQPRHHDDTKGAMTGAAQYVPSASQPQPAQHTSPVLDSGLTPSDHTLPAGMPTPADWQHRLPEKKRSQVLAALTSPWLFLMLSLILLAYFIASLL